MTAILPRSSTRFYIQTALVFLILIGQAQGEPSADPLVIEEAWRWRTYHELEGKGLRCMEEAADGSIWFGVADGILKYDGLAWTQLEVGGEAGGLPVNVLLRTETGDMLAGTETGVYRHADGIFRREFPREGGFPVPIDDLFQARDGAVWAGTPWGALRLGQDGSTLHTSSDFASAARHLDPELRIVVVPDTAVVATPWTAGRPTGSLGLRVSEPGSEAKGSAGVASIVCQVAPEGPAARAGIVVGDALLFFNGARPVFHNYRLTYPKGESVTLTMVPRARQDTIDVILRPDHVPGSFGSFSVVDIHQSGDLSMWFGMDSGEIVKFAPAAPGSTESGTWRIYTQTDGLEQGRGPRTFQSSDGTIWVVSNDARAGINCFDGATWKVVRHGISGAKTTHTSICETSDGTLWIGGNSLLSVRDGTWRLHDPADLDLPSVRTRLLLTSDEHLWIAGFEDHAVRLDCSSDRVATYEGMAYQCESVDHARWFVTSQGVTRQIEGRWETFGQTDGVMDHPIGILASRSGVVWAFGSHRDAASLSAFTGSEWHRSRYAAIAVRLEKMVEGPNGDLWVHATGRTTSAQTDGVYACAPPDIVGQAAPELTTVSSAGLPGFLYALKAGPDGRLWAGGSYLARKEGRHWSPISEPRELATLWIEVIVSGAEGVWVGTRTNGLFESKTAGWRRHDTADGLLDNRVYGICSAPDSAIWVATANGISRFDGRSWTAFDEVLPKPSGMLRNGLLIGRDGTVWINHSRKNASLATTRYVVDRQSPETEVTFAAETVPEGRPVSISWRGQDRWKHTAEKDLEFAWRLDDGEWSAYSSDASTVLNDLSGGDHSLAVRARDSHFNEDPTPALARFTVLIPIWRQSWFIALMILFVSAIGIQTGRVVVRGRRLRRAVMDLDRDRALERVRAEVTAMKEPEDLEGVVGELLFELRQTGVSFDLCEIHIVDADAGLRQQYVGTPGGFAGRIEEPLDRATEEFMTVWQTQEALVRPVDEYVRSAQARVRESMHLEEGPPQTAVVDAPFEHGTLSLSTHSPQGFDDSEVELVQEFARVVALGYARYLDFQKLRSQNQELQAADALNSEFYEMVVHDLGQPVTSIQLCADNILGRIYGELSPRQIERLETIRLSTSQLMDLLGALRSHMDLDPKTRTPVPQLAREVAEVHLPLAESQGIALDVAAREAFARADSRYVREIITNLVSNALNYTESGRVSIAVEPDDNGFVVTSVRDTGMGIPKNELPQVFQKHYRTAAAGGKRSGKGLGLYFCKKYVEIMGGKIWVESETGRGSAFTFTLPEADPET